MGIFFSILSSGIFAIINYIDKFILTKYKLHPIVITVCSGFFALFISIIIFLFTGFYPADVKTILIIIASGFLTGLYVIPYYKALSTDETSRVIPLFQVVPVFVLILSFLFLGEKLLFRQYVGSALIIAASFLISLERVQRKIFSLRPAFWYMMLSGLMSAFAQVFYKFGVIDIPFWHTLPYEGIGIAISVIAILIYPNNFKKFKKETSDFKFNVWSAMAINETLYIFARYTGFYAISLIAVSIVSVLGGLQSVFVLLYGVLLTLLFPKIIKESLSHKTLGIKIFSILIMFIGLFLIFF